MAAGSSHPCAAWVSWSRLNEASCAAARVVQPTAAPCAGAGAGVLVLVPPCTDGRGPASER